MFSRKNENFYSFVYKFKFPVLRVSDVYYVNYVLALALAVYISFMWDYV